MFTSAIKKIRQFLRDDDGPTAVEYAVMLALIIVVCLVSIRLVGTQADSTFKDVNKAFNQKTDGNADGNGQI